MAKQAVGPIIRYLDKAVLLVCGGAFLYVVAMYGVVSPIKAGPEGGEQFGPGDIDPQIKVEAERLREKLRDAEPPQPNPDEEKPFERPNLSHMDDVLALAGVDASIPSPVPPGLPVPKGEDEVEQRKINLVDIVPPDKPAVMVGRSGLYLDPPGEFKPGSQPKTSNESFLQDSNWATVFVTFDRAKQEAMFRDAGYAGLQANALFLGLDVERRVQQPTGGWTDWAAVNATRIMEQPALPEPEVYKAEKGLYAVSDKDREAVDLFADLISDGDNNEAQCDLQRPLFPSIAYGDNWTYPRVDGADALSLDAEIQDTAACRYPECAGAGSSVDSNLSYDDLYKAAEELFKAEKYDAALENAEAARDKAERNNEDRNAKKANELADKIKIEIARVAQQRLNADRLPTQLLWAHDAGIGSLLSGRTYQYRVRVRVFNQYAGKPTLLIEPEQASVVEQVSPWSDPSDPFTIEPDTVIFVKSDKASKLEVKVEVFKWFTGEWFARQFNVTVGDMIGEPKKITTPRGKELVDFSTGATVVDIDFLRTAMIPARRGNKLENVQTTAFVYVDASGNLHENLLDLDKSSETYKRLRSAVWEEQ